MALEIYLEGTLNGEALEETAAATRAETVGGDDVSSMIECLQLSTGIDAPTQRRGLRRRGGASTRPISTAFRATGKTWPRWLKGCDRNEEFEGTFHLYRHALDGSVERAGSIAVERGRIISVRLESPSTVDPERSAEPRLLHVTIAYHTMTWTAEEGTEHVVQGSP